MMRFWHQSMTESQGMALYRETMTVHAASVVSDSTEVMIHHLPDGTYHGGAPSDVMDSPYLSYRATASVVSAAITAEAQGYDAFILGSFSDPLVRETRSAVDIPVVSLGESNMLVACSLGRYQALISNAPGVAHIVREHVTAWGLTDRVSEVTFVEPPLNEPALIAAYEDPRPLIDSFTRAARAAISRGADAVIPAEGVMSELLYKNGVTSVESVPVLDSFGTAWNYAEMLVDLWRRTGLRVGRAWTYTRGPNDVLEEFLAEETGHQGQLHKLNS